MTFLDFVDYGGCTWSAFLREDGAGRSQLVFRALSPRSPVAACLSPLEGHAGYAIQAAARTRPFLLEDILARQMDRARLALR